MTLAQRRPYPTRKVFLFALAAALLAFLPYQIYHNGYFFYYGDFNVQQIPFYQLAHDAVRSGNFGWSWTTDLGANFIGSYSFYLLFSPFFWLTIPFPTSFLPYLMAPLLALKIACAAVTSFWYLRRFIQDQRCAGFCAMLYAFSGYSVYNIFFNHFHEAIVFFPLLLIGLEEAMVNNRRGAFALGIAVNAVVNYWFFIGEVVFVVFYFLIRLGSSSNWKLTLRKFFFLAAETLLGMGLAMAAFLPSVLAILGNPRMTESTVLSGANLWYYSNPQRYLGILHSFFFAPDLPALNNYFPDHGAQWASLSAYLPLVGTVCTIAYFAAAKKTWLKRLLITCAVLALVPMGNHLFVVMNYSYYARWYYMPTLMLVLATAAVLEQPNRYPVYTGFKITGGAIALILVISGLTPTKTSDGWEFGLYANAPRFLVTGLITVACFIAFLLLMHRCRENEIWRRRLYQSITVCCCLFASLMMLIGKTTYPNNDWIADLALPNRDKMLLDDSVFARSDLYEFNENLGMYWNIPNIQAFHSIVPVSLMEFYPDIGVKRDVSSKPETRYYELRSFLSVRWLYIDADNKNQNPMPGYSYAGTISGVNIYENDNFIPMGFSYDQYYTREHWDSLSATYRSRALLSAICLEDDFAERYPDLLEPVGNSWENDLSIHDWTADAAERRTMTCDSFTVTKTGFTATSSFDQNRIVFFSVPYDAGWSAEVNGSPVTIEKANVGFMAVVVPAGDSEIVFTYHTPGLKTGSIISIVSLLFFALWLLTGRKKTVLSGDFQVEYLNLPVGCRIDLQPSSLPTDISDTEDSTIEPQQEENP